MLRFTRFWCQILFWKWCRCQKMTNMRYDSYSSKDPTYHIKKALKPVYVLFRQRAPGWNPRRWSFSGQIIFSGKVWAAQHLSSCSQCARPRRMFRSGHSLKPASKAKPLTRVSRWNEMHTYNYTNTHIEIQILKYKYKNANTHIRMSIWSLSAGSQQGQVSNTYFSVKLDA